MEILDILDESGSPTGKTVVRGTALNPGEYHLVVHVWVRNEAGQYLIQQRAAHLASDPGIWATTAGHVQAGEDSRSGAIREIAEEMGITLSPLHLQPFHQLKTGKRIEHVWLATVSSQAVGTPSIGDEVSAYQWATKSELAAMISRGEFYGYSYFDALPD